MEATARFKIRPLFCPCVCTRALLLLLLPLSVHAENLSELNTNPAGFSGVISDPTNRTNETD
jgi:hypothetical protein